MSLKDCEDELQSIRDKINVMNKEFRKKMSECDIIKYEDFIKTYFPNPKLTHEELLDGIKNYYLTEKGKDMNFTLTLQELINKFPRDQPVHTTNYKKQHVFEALCRLLLVTGCDNGEFGKKTERNFYKSLETLSPTSEIIDESHIMSTPVNESSAGGIVDILFRMNPLSKVPEPNHCGPRTEVKASSSPLSKSKVVMVQNKYYDREKSNIDKYDVARIHIMGSEKFKGKEDMQIVLMVNNKDVLSANLMKSKQQFKDLNIDIYGVVEIDVWFQRMLQQMRSNPSGLSSTSGNDEPEQIIPRFHQSFISQATMEYHESMGITKFIWGAVPRSGKTYMIADLIKKRKMKENNIVIILGAKTETESQFVEIFTKYNELSSNFNVVTSNGPEPDESPSKRIVYILSQEWFKSGKTVNKKIKDNNFTQEFKNKFPRLCERQIDLFFDEIHKGGTTDNSSSIIQAFINAGNDQGFQMIDIFVMVTATFAKPTARYDDSLTSKFPTITLEWSYDDQQNMKQVINETKKQLMLNGKLKPGSTLEYDVMKNLFDEYQMRYGEEYLQILSDEYNKYPELVIITPEILEPDEGVFQSSLTTDVRNIFAKNLKCDSCVTGKPVEFYENPANIFAQEGPITDLMNYIGKKLYNQFHIKKGKFDYNISSPHTELWFLPDNNLYQNQDECRDVCKESRDQEISDEYEDKTTIEKGIPNIEPLTRGLASKILSNPKFEKYNVFIVHGTKLDYLGKGIKPFASSVRVKYWDTNPKISLKEQISNYEKDSFSDGQSVIILTGAKLRLGISLECVDIAFNFDNISSIDTNYQTMFRVLTERNNKSNPKKYGYYVDFNKDRSIDFLYQYSTIYGEKSGERTLKDKIKYLQTLLFSFNYNGLGLVDKEGNSQIGLYSELIEKMSLDEASYQRYWSKDANLVSLIKKALIASTNRERLDEIVRLFQSKPISGKKRHTVKEGKSRASMPAIPGQAEEPDEISDGGEEDEPEGNIDDTVEMLANSIPGVVSLMAIYSQGKCENITECISVNIEEIKRISGDYCKCDDGSGPNNIIDCFLNSPDNVTGEIKFDKKNLVKILELIKSEMDDNKLMRDSLEFKFNAIIEEMKRSKGNTDALILSMTPEEIRDFIVDNLTIKTEEKNKYGEVFTPYDLIGEMLDTLPIEVWGNPKLTWLDPANGIGNFPMIVYSRLMDGLKKWQPDERKRSKHIIENMLFMVEINPKNVKISRRIFGENANIYCGDFLDRDFGVEKFDIIIGNPPFNDSQENEGKKGGGDSLWPKFVIKTIELLKKNKYLLFVHPSGWRKPESAHSKNNGMFKLMAHDNQIKYLEIHNTTDGNKVFNAGTRYDWYLLEKRKIYENTIIKDETGKDLNMNLSEWRFLPNHSYELVKSLLAKNTDETVDVIYSRNQYGTDKSWVSKDKINEFKYPLIHSTPLKDPRKFYTSTKTPVVKQFMPMFGVRKVIFGDSGINKVIVDFDGEYGMTQHAMGIIITSKEEGEQLAGVLEGEQFKQILSAMSHSNYQIDWRMFRYFKKDFWKTLLTSSSHKLSLTPTPPVKSSRRKLTIKKLSKSPVKSSPPTPPVKKSLPTRRTRCPNGTRRNKKTGDCESVSPIRGKGVRKNRRTRRKKKRT
jgi:hypothetical protein